MQLHELKPPKGAKKKKKRVGRGIGSGHGKTSGRGHKGQKQRSHPGIRPYFEGGQMPLIRRIPKRGFSNKRFAIEYQIVNVSDLNRFEEGTVITPKLLKQESLIRYEDRPLKILGDGELEKKFEVHAHAFSKTAKEKIEAKGGKTVLLEL
jgi:large subunit ribosomal protein L15